MKTNVIGPGPATFFIVVALAGCTGGLGQTGGGRGGSGDITRADLDGTSFSSAYNAVERLRPTWLRPRGAPTLSQDNPFPVVYVDGMRRGDLDELQAMPVGDLQTIGYLSPADATTRFGLGHTSGAIVVTTSH